MRKRSNANQDGERKVLADAEVADAPFFSRDRNVASPLPSDANGDATFLSRVQKTSPTAIAPSNTLHTGAPQTIAASAPVITTYANASGRLRRHPLAIVAAMTPVNAARRPTKADSSQSFSCGIEPSPAETNVKMMTDGSATAPRPPAAPTLPATFRPPHTAAGAAMMPGIIWKTGR